MVEKKKKADVIHVDKFMDGVATPQEVHRALGINKKCVGCGAPAAIRIRVLALYSELVERNPDFVALMMAASPDGATCPTIPTQYGPMVLVTDNGACEQCQTTAEVAAARGVPDWCIVEIDRGPKETVQVQVPRGSA